MKHFPVIYLVMLKMSTGKILFLFAVIFLEETFGQHQASIVEHQVVRWIESPRLTTWGKWGENHLCPSNSWVSGMNLKVESSQGNKGDDTGLNTIMLLCTTLDGKHVADITSKEGAFGDFRGKKYCNNGFATGFQLRSEPDKGSKDEIGAVDLKLKCTNVDGTVNHIVGGGVLSEGIWTEEQICPRETAICGIATQVQEGQGSKKDDTSLNNLNVACCKIPHPLENCDLEKKWENVITCHAGVENCNIKISTGIIQQHSEAISESSKFYEKLGYGTGMDFVLKMFKGKIGFNKETPSEKINGKSLASILNEVNSQQEEWSFRLGCVGAGEELILICGNYKVKTKEFRCVPDDDNRKGRIWAR